MRTEPGTVTPTAPPRCTACHIDLWAVPVRVKSPTHAHVMKLECSACGAKLHPGDLGVGQPLPGEGGP